MHLPDECAVPLGEWLEEATEIVNASANGTLSANVHARTLQMASRQLVARTMNRRYPTLKEPSEDAGLVILPTAGISAKQARRFAGRLDKHIFDYHPDVMKCALDEYDEAQNMRGLLLQFPKLLQKYFGDETQELQIALLQRLTKDILIGTGKTIGDMSKWFHRRQVAHLKKTAPLTTEHESSLCELLLTPEIYEKLLKRLGSNENVLQRFVQIASRSVRIRHRLLQSLRALVDTPDRLVSAALMRRAWLELMDIEEAGDRAWWESQLRALTALEADATQFDEECSTEEEKKYHHKKKADTRAWMQQHPAYLDDGLDTLRERIGCEFLRADLDQLYKEHNWIGAAAQERAILGHVMAACSRYSYDAEAAKHTLPVYTAGSPAHMLEKKTGNCFSGPWLIAMMLLECGISEEDILYLQVHQDHNDRKAAHGSLLLATSARELLIADLGAVGKDFPYRLIEKPAMEQSLKDLVAGRRIEPVTLRFDPLIAKKLALPVHMQAERLRDGLAGGHLLHVGASFVAEKKWQEAEHAFALGLSFSPNNPELQYNRGLALQSLDKPAEAERSYRMAIASYKDHLWSHFALAELLMHQGKTDEALMHFRKVAFDKGTLWGDARCKTQAWDRVIAELRRKKGDLTE